MPVIACLLMEPTERTLEACARLTPVVEPLGDRILMDWTGCGPVAELAQTLRERLHRSGEDHQPAPEYRLGVAPLRFAAEALAEALGEGLPAGRDAKPNPSRNPARIPGQRAKGRSRDVGHIHITGGRYVTEQTLATFIQNLPVTRLPGIDPRTKQTLASLALGTLGDLPSIPAPLLRDHVGPIADPLLDWARGHDARSVAPLYPPERMRQRISAEALSNVLTVSQGPGLSALVSAALEPLTTRLEATGRAMSHGAVYGGPGAEKRRMRTFTEPLADPDQIVRALQRLVEDVLTDPSGAESSGFLSFPSDLIIEIVPTRESPKQMTLWDGNRPRNARQARLQTVLDSLQDRFGDVIGFTQPRQAVVRYETMLHLYGAKG